MGADISAEISESKEIMAKFIAVFGVQYSKMYLVALMKLCKKEIAKEARGPQWVLTKCDKCPPPQVQKTGVVKKLSKYLKKWNQRFMVVRGDYLIDYYESEEKYNAKAKPLGSINMSNRQLHRDANDTVLNRLIALAEKCKINLDDMPKPDKYPDFTLEIHHDRKGAIYLECPGEEEWKSWCDIIEKCRWHAPRYNLYEDKAHLFAFPNALWRTRWECDMWGWWWGGGGEEAMIVDAINDKIADVVLYKLDCRLTMPWAARSKIRNQFISTVDGLVSTAVGPAWKAAYEAVKKVRPEVQAKVKEGMQPIVEAQQSIQAEICKQVEAGSKDFIAEKVLPHLAPLLDVVFAPVVDAFKIVIRAFDVALEKGKEKYETKEDRLFMVWRYNYNSEYWDAERKLWDLYEPLWALRLVFDDIYPWNICGRARRRLRKTLDNALYTFENILEDGKATGKSWDEAAAETRRLLARDCQSAIMRVLGHILFGVVENFFEKLVIRPARKLIAPLAEKVPQAIKDFVDPEDLLEELLYNILRSTCANVFQPYASRIDLGVDVGTADTVITRSVAAPAAAPVAESTPAPADNAARDEEHRRASEAAAAEREAEDARREEEQRRHAEEAARRAEEDARRAEEDARRAEEEARRAEEESRQAQAARQQAADDKAAEEARQAEEDARRAEEEARRAEEDARRAEEEARRAEEEARRAEEEARRAEEAARRAEEEGRRAEEAARHAEEEARVADEARRAEAEAAAAKAAADAAAAEAAARAAEVAARAAEDAARDAEEAAKAAESSAKAAEEDAKIAEEEAKAAEEVAKAAAEEAAIPDALSQDGDDEPRTHHVDPNTDTSDGEREIELIYFPLPGRAQPIRLVFAIANIPFKDTRVSFQEYGALMAQGELPLDTLPVLKIEGRIVSVQSGAILRLAAEMAEMNLTTPDDILRGEDVAGTASDIGDLWGKWFASDAKEECAKELLQSGFPFYAKRIETILADGTRSGPFVTDCPTFVDVLVYCVCGYVSEVARSIGEADPVLQFPKLAELIAAVNSIPAVQSYQ